MKRTTNGPTMPIEEAAKMLGMSANFLRELLRDGKMREVGFAVQAANDTWRYYVYRAKVKALIEGKGETA